MLMRYAYKKKQHVIKCNNISVIIFVFNILISNVLALCFLLNFSQCSRIIFFNTIYLHPLYHVLEEENQFHIF